MRTDREFLDAMHARAERIEREARVRRARLIGLGATCGGLAAVVLLALFMSSYEALSLPAEASARASLFTESSALGYVVIGVTAFLLGVAVTILCYRLRKDQDGEP